MGAGAVTRLTEVFTTSDHAEGKAQADRKRSPPQRMSIREFAIPPAGGPSGVNGVMNQLNKVISSALLPALAFNFDFLLWFG